MHSSVLSLTGTERRILVGPAVVGTVIGALVALALAGVRAEYGHNMEPLYFGINSGVAEALLTFAIVTGATVLLFGVVPLLINRVVSRPPIGPNV